VSGWDDVVGQPEAVGVLQLAAAGAADIVAGRSAPAGGMTHAWLFTGPPGSGRSVAARAFAAALLCDRDGVGCGECAGCHTVHTGTHGDLHQVVPEGLSIAVQEMRAIVVAAARRPVGGRW
jgi:DNA polymerase III subunit delta'